MHLYLCGGNIKNMGINMGPKDLPKGAPMVVNAAAFYHRWTAVRVVSYDKKAETYSVVVEWDNTVDGVTYGAGDALHMHRHCFFDSDEDIQGDEPERERLREHLRSGVPKPLTIKKPVDAVAYWKKRCELAERLLINNDIADPLNHGKWKKEWQEWKDQRVEK